MASTSILSLFITLGSGALVLGACGGGADTSTFDPNAVGPTMLGGNYSDGGSSYSSTGVYRGADEILDAGCATATSSASRQPVYMLIVLDGSGSMDKDNKWKAVVPALDSFFDDLRAKADPGFALGLTVFSDKADPTMGAGPYPQMSVPIGFVDAAHAAAFHTRIDRAVPKNATPTFAALSGQYPLLEAYVPAAPLLPDGKKVLVLMTDGVPYPDPATQQPKCIALSAAEQKKGITTFAVGIGNLTPADPASYDPKFMGALATAGGTAPAGCDPNNITDPSKMCHFQVTPGGKTAAQVELDFIDAINKIRGAVASCEYTIDKSGGTADPSKVNVIYTDGAGHNQLVPEGGADGWTYDDPKNPGKVILHGQSCDTAKADANGKIKIVLGCKSVVN